MKNKIIVILERIKSRFLAFWLAVALAFLLVIPEGISFAFSNGSDTDIDTLFESLPCYNAQVPLNALSAVSAHIVAADSNVLAVCYYALQSDSQLTFVCEHGDLIIGDNGYIFCSSPSETVYLSSVSYFSYSADGFGLSSDTSIDTPSLVVNGVDYYRTDFALNNFMMNNGIVFCSNDFQNNNNAVAANLDISAYYPDLRHFEIYKTDRYTPSDMIAVSVDTSAIFDVFSYFTFSYTDSAGIWTSTVVDNNYYEVYYGDDYSVILIDPSLLSTFSYTLTGGTFYGSVSWGDYEFTSNIYFDLSDIDYSPPSQVNNYYSSTSSILYNGGSVYGYTYFKCDTVDSLFWDDDLVLCQPFSYSLIALPILGSYGPSWSSGDFYSSFLSYYSSYYDVILIDVPETTFNALYGSGAYTDFQSNYSTSTMGAFISSVSTWYSAHPLQLSALPFSDIDDLPLYTSNQMVGIAFSDHFFYKQIAYMLGDTSDILTEFSSRFFEEDVFSDKFFTSLTSFYDLQYNFSTNNLIYLYKLVYFCDYLNRENFFPDIVSNLIAANNYLSGLDLKLSTVISRLDSIYSDGHSSNSYLSSIVSQLTDEYTFLSQDLAASVDSSDTGIWSVYDEIVNLNTSVEGLCTQLEISLSPNIEVSFPDIDLTVLVEQYGDGVEPLFDFFQNWILIIPEFDYSDFSDWFDNAGTLVSSLADSNGNFVNDILDPYNYSDSGVSDFGWD